MPQDNGMALVIILHLSPHHQSIADKIIQESTKMPALQVTETVPSRKTGGTSFHRRNGWQ